MTTTKVTKPDTFTAQAVEMLDRKGRRHLVAKVNENWCSRKYIASRDSFSGQWLMIGMGTDQDMTEAGMVQA